MCTGLRRTWDFCISAYFAWPYATFLFHSAAQAVSVQSLAGADTATDPDWRLHCPRATLSRREPLVGSPRAEARPLGPFHQPGVRRLHCPEGPQRPILPEPAHAGSVAVRGNQRRWWRPCAKDATSRMITEAKLALMGLLLRARVRSTSPLWARSTQCTRAAASRNARSKTDFRPRPAIAIQPSDGLIRCPDVRLPRPSPSGSRRTVPSTRLATPHQHA